MLELFKSIDIDKAIDTPLYTQIYDQLKKMILDGLLLNELKLPSVRQFTKLLNVNQVTIVSALKHLENEGLIYSKPGSGTFVANINNRTSNRFSQDQSLILDELYQNEDFPLISGTQISIKPDTINFASATPTPDLFPVDDFKSVLNEVLDRDKGNAFDYQDSHGFFPLRESISQLVANNQIKCSTDHVQIISGAQQGIDIISKAMLKEGDVVVTESPTYTGAIAVFKSRGAEIIDLDMLEDGPNMNLVEYNFKKYKPKLVYTIPSYQNPTGYSYSEEKRINLLKLAEKYNCYIIEDDYVSDLCYEGKKLKSLKSLDKNERVIFIKSFSKIFMPGLRLGFMIVPHNFLNTILEAKHSTDISTSGLIQRAFDQYIRKGFWDKHFNFMYDIYKERYGDAILTLDKYLPKKINYVKPQGGLNLWFKLPFDVSVNNILSQAVSENIVFAPGKIFYSNDSIQKMNCFRISFAAVDSVEIKDGLKKLSSLIESNITKTDTNKRIQLF